MMIRFLLPLLATPLIGAEIAVEAKPFRVERDFTATVIPATMENVRLEPLSWKDFVIESVAPHGSEVAEGDVLVRFEREPFERSLEDRRAALKKKELDLAGLETALSQSKKDVELKLEARKAAKLEADDDLGYFVKTGRPAQEASITQNLKQVGFRLEAAKEELKQLRKMYAEDDLTEETEEIILKRQQDAVESAEFSLREAGRNSQRSLESALPREAARLERSAKAAALELETAEKTLQRGLERERLELEEATLATAREKLELERLEKDGALLEIKAAAGGVFYHGRFEDGIWQLGELSKVLIKGGKAPLQQSFACVVPADGETILQARVGPEVAGSLEVGTKLTLTVPGREDLTIVGEATAVSAVPGADGKHLVDLKAEWPEKVGITRGLQLQCRAVVYEKDEVFAVPAKALRPGAAGGWALKIKLADGGTESREIQRGRIAGEMVEVLSGLEAGQVIITPE